MMHTQTPVRLAVHSLPPEYQPVRRLDLMDNRRLLVLMNILGLGLFVFFAWLFTWAALIIRPEAADYVWKVAIAGWGDLLLLAGGLLGITAMVVILHEAVHGFFFWVFTGSRPHFEFRIVYAAASAPGWYLPSCSYLVVGLAPLVILSALGMLMIRPLPLDWLQPLLVFLVLNASGAVGDILVTAWVLLFGRGCLVSDQATVITLFASKPG